METRDNSNMYAIWFLECKIVIYAFPLVESWYPPFIATYASNLSATPLNWKANQIHSRPSLLL